MWRLLRELQEVAFPELDKQDLLAELCRALLRCGQWSLAQRYLTGTGSTPMNATRAEKLVLQIGACLWHAYFAQDLVAFVGHRWGFGLPTPVCVPADLRRLIDPVKVSSQPMVGNWRASLCVEEAYVCCNAP